MKILILNHSDNVGGAARAAYRLYMLFKQKFANSEMFVRVKKSDSSSVFAPKGIYSFLSKIRYPLSKFILKKLLHIWKQDLISLNMIPSSLSRIINESDADIVNIHWIAGETISFKDLSRIKKPLVWTMHDMWPFIGAEHYIDESRTDWLCGYKNLFGKFGIINRYLWRKKLKTYSRLNICFVSPSKWLAEKAKLSGLLQGMRIEVIPNPINFDIFKPLDKEFSRKALNLSLSSKIILFGAVGGVNDQRKGYTLLYESLMHLSDKISNKENIECVFFGQSEQPKEFAPLPFKCTWFGVVNDDVSLSLLYNAADITVVPSRMENLPQICTEAQSCGCPVVAFNTTGISETIEHNKTGYLANAFDTLDLSKAMYTLLFNNDLNKMFSANASERARFLWNGDSIAKKYESIFSSLKE